TFWLVFLVDVPPPFWLFCETIFLVVLPFTGFAALQSEVTGSNIQLLLLTPLSRWRVVSGKWFLLAALSALILISLLPYFVVRYFFGGIDIVQTAFLAAWILTINAPINAIIVGASAYKNQVLRFWMIAYQLVSAALTMAIAIASVFYLLDEVFGMEITTSPLLYNLLIGLLTGVTAGLYTTLGLQLGRGRISLFEHSLVRPESGAVTLLLFAAPIFVGIVTIITIGFGTLPALLIIGWSAYKLDSNASEPPPQSTPGASTTTALST
ncbi:MAG: hypothetical protein P8J87_15510, partial [Verrucomicrobiales bacterium]|nr:hypothetical protein [Verrucomicrobiales bacterium]